MNDIDISIISRSHHHRLQARNYEANQKAIETLVNQNSNT